jgi:hypothetical protein
MPNKFELARDPDLLRAQLQWRYLSLFIPQRSLQEWRMAIGDISSAQSICHPSTVSRLRRIFWLQEAYNCFTIGIGNLLIFFYLLVLVHK